MAGLKTAARNYEPERAECPSPEDLQTPYLNTIPVEEQPDFPGNPDVERRISNLVRWNAMAMVVRANREESGIGGHISTYASAATLYDVGFNHFFRGPDHDSGGDYVYFQGHASPGNYARAYLERRMTEENLRNFRREIRSRDGLSSYPHPWLMPDFWEFPTVSMGLGPIQAIYRARFLRYLENRGLRKRTDAKVWAFVGDGETDEPETLGALTLAGRERLDNLIFVVNCNLQRLDGPVRGNGKIIQELETAFRGAGWNVIKVIWGSEWDPLFARDHDGALAKRLRELVDGEYQKFFVEGPGYVRKALFDSDPRLAELTRGYSDDQIRKLRLGGHDPVKLYAAYHVATHYRCGPTVILAKTIKGYGLGETGEGRNITHQQKKLTEEELRSFRDRFLIPVSDEDLARVPFYRPPADSPEISYLQQRRRTLGGYLPKRKRGPEPTVTAPNPNVFAEFLRGTSREVATTMAFVRMLSKLTQDPSVGKYIVPIVPDEARTFGMDALFQQWGIYSSVGQRYEPVDAANLLFYKEARDGQLLEEGITEAGSMCSFIAAGTASVLHGVPTLPVFLFYSMFGFQRVADLIWAAADSRARGFLIGGTAGRTTLAGEGLQHQDGQSHVLALPVPNLRAYDPAYAYEIAVIVEDGIRRMMVNKEDIFYYLTVGNEPYAQLAMPGDVRDGILRGIYPLMKSPLGSSGIPAQILASGSLVNEAIHAQRVLAERYGVAADLWSVTSYKELRRDAQETERWNLLHPDEPPRLPYLTQVTRDAAGIFVAVSDYMKALPDLVAKWLPGPLYSLGTDGFGRSDGRAALRDFFEVDHRYITYTTLYGLAVHGSTTPAIVSQAIRDLSIDPDRERK